MDCHSLERQEGRHLEELAGVASSPQFKKALCWHQRCNQDGRNTSPLAAGYWQLEKSSGSGLSGEECAD